MDMSLTSSFCKLYGYRCQYVSFVELVAYHQAVKGLKKTHDRQAHVHTKYLYKYIHQNRRLYL